MEPNDNHEHTMPKEPRNFMRLGEARTLAAEYGISRDSLDALIAAHRKEIIFTPPAATRGAKPRNYYRRNVLLGLLQG